MTSPELTTFITAQLQTGNNPASIAAQLRSAGWAEADIQSGLQAAGVQADVPQQQPATQAQQTAQPANTQPVAPFQPSAAPVSSPVTKVNGPEANMERQRIPALLASIASIVAFLVTFFIFGYIFVLAAILGAYGLSIGIRLKSKLIIILGSIGAGVNLVMYCIAVIAG